MAEVWDLLSNSSYHSDNDASKILEHLKTYGYSHANCEEFVSALFRDSTNDCWRHYLFSNHSSDDALLCKLPSVRVAGSWIEGLNVGQEHLFDELMTEIDFMFTFGFVGNWGPLILERTSDPGYYLVRVRSSLFASQLFLDSLCIKRNSNYYLSPEKSVMHMEKTIRHFFKNCEIRTHNPDSENPLPKNCPVVTLKFPAISRSKEMLDFHQDLMIDFAPVFEVDLPKPNTNINFLEEFERSDVLHEKLLLVAKNRKDALQWRISTSLGERKIFKILTLKNVDMPMRILKSAKLLKFFHIKGETSIKSYHLKTTLLHWLNDNYDRIFQWDKNLTMEPLISDYFNKLSLFIEKCSMPHFFFPEINLFDGVDLSSENLRNFCNSIRNEETVAKFLDVKDYESDILSIEDEVFMPLMPSSSLDVPNQLQFNSTQTFLTQKELGIAISETDLFERINCLLNEVNQSVSYSDIIKLKKYAALTSNDVITKLINTKFGYSNSANIILSSGSLHFAVVEGAEDKVRFLLEFGAGVNEMADGKTPLYLAVENNHFSMAKLLLHGGAKVNSLVDGNMTPLLKAINLNHEEIVSLLLQHNANVNSCFGSSVSCLSAACFRGNIKIMQMLLENGAIINNVESNDITVNYMTLPLNCTIINQFDFALNQHSEKKTYELVNFLLKHGAEVNPTNVWFSPLSNAALRCYVTVVKLLLENGSKVNRLNVDGATALITAAKKGHFEIMHLLLEHGAEVNVRDNYGVTALLCAAKRGDNHIVKLLYEYGAKLNCENNDSHVPLIQAARKRHASTVSILLEKGASVNASDVEGNNALHVAAVFDDITIGRLLLKHKADVNQKNKSMSSSPLHMACLFGNENVARLLLEAGADVNAKTLEEETALHQATSRGWFKIVKLLVEFGAEIDLKLPDGYTCFHLACQLGFTKIVQFLVHKNADINMPQESANITDYEGAEGGTGLIWAARNGKMDVVKLLLEMCDSAGSKQRIDVNFQSKGGSTALHIAAAQGCYEMTRMLLEHGAKTEVLSASGASPLCLAIIADFPSKVSLLLDFNASTELRYVQSETCKYTPIACAMNLGKNAIVQILIDRGADVNATFSHDGKIYTPLILSILRENATMIRLLLAGNADFLITHETIGYNAFYAAAYKGNLDIFNTFLDFASYNKHTSSGLQQHRLLNIINCSNDHNDTALAAAAQKGHLQIAQLLLKKGANVNVLDADGDSPLHLASSSGHLELVQLLLGNGAQINRRNKSGNTPLWNAMVNDHVKIIDMLIHAGADINIRPTNIVVENN